jgi:hypothetical protein
VEPGHRQPPVPADRVEMGLELCLGRSQCSVLSGAEHAGLSDRQELTQLPVRDPRAAPQRGELATDVVGDVDPRRDPRLVARWHSLDTRL